MKLYNIFESIILEEKKALLTEALTTREELKDAIDGKYQIWFKYKDTESSVTDRYVQVYQLGMSRANNEMISAYQSGGKTHPTKKDNKPYGWKQFIIDKIVPGSIIVKNKKNYQAISDTPSFYTDDEVANARDMMNKPEETDDEIKARLPRKYNSAGSTSGPNRQFKSISNKINFNK